MPLKDYGLVAKDGEIRLPNKRKGMSEDELFIYLKGRGINISEIEDTIRDLRKEVDKQSVVVDISKLKVDVVKELNPFKNLTIVTNTTERSDVVYYRNGSNTEIICSLADFGSKELRSILRRYESDFLDELHYRMASLVSAKDWTLLSDLQVLDICFNTGMFNSTVEKIVVKQDMHPAVLEGCDKFSLTTIPYEYNESAELSDLHPYLRDFLERTENHEYLCAILYSHCIGNLLPYVVYLRGDGGDGKTSFVSMLGRITRSFATFDSSERFNYFNMYGKSIIALSENESSKIMQNRIVKSISGGSYVSIEGKGRNSFSGQVRGMIIVDSNYDLELLGREDEKRRLRYFRISPIKKDENYVDVQQDYLIEMMASTSNKFLNYCRKWYEILEVKGSYGLIEKNPNHDRTFQELVDVIQEHKFDEFYRNYIDRRYTLGGSCSSLEILIELERRFPKDYFASRNFKKYLEVNYSIKSSGKVFIGLSKQDKELEDAMPK